MKKTALTLAAIIAFAVTTEVAFAENASSDAVLAERLLVAETEEQKADLITLMQERSSDVVRVALESVAKNNAETGDIRMLALCGLARSATSESVPLVMEILQRDVQERTGLWACAIPLLGEVKDRRALPLLYQIAELDEEHLVGMDHMAISAICSMAEVEDVPFLQAKAHIVPVRTDAIVALSRLAEPSSVDVLISGLLEGEDPEVISSATAGLMKIGTPALPQLRDTLETYPDEALRARLQKLIDALD